MENRIFHTLNKQIEQTNSFKWPTEGTLDEILSLLYQVIFLQIAFQMEVLTDLQARSYLEFQAPAPSGLLTAKKNLSVNLMVDKWLFLK